MKIVKAVLLLGGATVLAPIVLARFDWNPTHLFAAAAAKYDQNVLAPSVSPRSRC